MANNPNLYEIWSFISEKKEKEATDINRLFNLWRRLLTNRISRLFEWNGLPFEQHELEIPVMTCGVGFCVYHDKSNGVVAGRGSVYGENLYPDVFTKCVYSLVRTEGQSISGVKDIGVDAVVLKNTSLMFGMDSFIDRYASLLTHADLSLKCALIGDRYQDILVSSDSNSRDSIESYFQSKYEGSFAGVLDETMLMIEGGGTVNLGKQSRTPSYTMLVETHNEIMRNFYRDMGIRWTREKRGNMTEDEVVSDSSMLTFNVADMLHCRESFCNEYNKVFEGRAKNISVKLSVEYRDMVDESEVKEDERKENDNNGVSEN